MVKIAAITMVYNEPEYVPIWCRYYGSLFGAENCYIIDHGTNDGSTKNLLGYNVVRIPRSPMDDQKRTRYISAFCSALLEWYDGFIHTDVDEMVVQDPDKFPTMQHYLESLEVGTYTAIGFDIQHDPVSEAALDLSRPVTWQRRWIRFSSSMCKPVLSFKPLEWKAGFHSANCKLEFSDLYLFHLRYFDLALGLERLRRTRGMPWAQEQAGSHQRVADEEFVNLVERAGRLPKRANTVLSAESGPLLAYLDRVRDSEKDYLTNPYSIDLHIFGEELFDLPRKFVGRF